MSRVRDLADNNVVFVDGITTADITEHTNLFFTDARADARLALKMVDEDNMSSNSAAHMPTQQSVKAYVDTEVASLVDSSPSTLDTLNELAAALGDDANFSTTVTNSIATKLPLAGGTMTGALIINAGDNGLDVRVGTDKRILFAGNIGEIGSVAGFQAVNTAGNANTAFGIRATDIRFATGSDERVRITDAGVGIGLTTSIDRKLHVQNDNDYAAKFGGTGSGDYAIEIGQIGTGGSAGFNATGVNGAMKFLISGSEKMRVAAPSGYVGIGTTNPTAPLEVHHASVPVLKVKATSSSGQAALYLDGYTDGGSTNRASRINFRKDTSTEWSIINDYDQNDSNKLDFEYVGSRKVTFTSDGNVGIGTDNPSHKLEVFGTAADGTELVHISSNGDVPDGGYHWMTTEIAGSQTTNANIIHMIGKELASKNSGYFGFHYAGDHSNDNFITIGGYAADQLLNIKMNGDVGIGLTNPSERLQIGGNLRAGNTGATTSFDSGGNDRYIGVSSLSGGDAMFIAHASGYGVAYFGYEPTDDKLIIACDNGGGNNKIDFSVNATTNSSGSVDNLSGITPAMRIAGSGNVGIGTTNPTEKLHVAGVIRSEGYDTDSITSYNITGSYTAGTEYVFTTRSQLNGLGYGAGFYKFLVWSDTFHAGTSHYQCYTPYDEFFHNNYGSNTSTVQTINYGVSMGHAPNTGTRAIDIRLRHKYGADATYPANQTFTFIPVNGFTNLNGNAGYHLRIYLFKVA